MVQQEGPGWRLSRDISRNPFPVLIGGENWAFELTEYEWTILAPLIGELLDEHQITHEQLVDLGIMVGTDFHPGIRGIGPKTGLKLIKEYGTIEAVCEAKEKELPERLDEIRELFMNHPVSGELPVSGMTDEDGFSIFLSS